MNPAELAKIAKPWIKVLGLEHWKIKYQYGGCGNGQARVTFLTGYQMATLRVYEDWSEESDDKTSVCLESVVLHELIELALAEYRQMEFQDKETRAHYIAEKFERILFDLKEEVRDEGWVRRKDR